MLKYLRGKKVDMMLIVMSRGHVYIGAVKFGGSVQTVSEMECQVLRSEENIK